MDTFCMKRQSGLYMPGRLYLFERHVGFHSQMWGYTVTRTVELTSLKVCCQLCSVHGSVILPSRACTKNAMLAPTAQSRWRLIVAPTTFTTSPTAARWQMPSSHSGKPSGALLAAWCQTFFLCTFCTTALPLWSSLKRHSQRNSKAHHDVRVRASYLQTFQRTGTLCDKTR